MTVPRQEEVSFFFCYTKAHNDMYFLYKYAGNDLCLPNIECESSNIHFWSLLIAFSNYTFLKDIQETHICLLYLNSKPFQISAPAVLNLLS